MHIKFHYKSYKESKIATLVSIIGGTFNVIGKAIPVIIIIQLGSLLFRENKNEKSKVVSIIIFFIVISIIMFIIGFIFNIIAKK